MSSLIFLDEDLCYKCKENKIVAHYLCKECLSNLDYVANKFKLGDYDAHAVYFYNESMKKLIGDYKFNRNTSLSKVFASILYDYCIINDLFSLDYILPSPSSNSTINRRGFDHIKLITNEFIGKTKCEYLEGFKKIKKTKAQHNLDKEERANNLNGAFSLNYDISNKSVLLIDDLITTGNTAYEIIKELENSNVKEVIVLAITSEHRVNN